MPKRLRPKAGRGHARFQTTCLPGPKRLLIKLRQQPGLLGPQEQADAHLGSALPEAASKGYRAACKSMLDSVSMW